jgi:hypothetical protein
MGIPNVANNIIGRQTNPLQNMQRNGTKERASSITSKLSPGDGWKHVDTKFGLNMLQAETHRKILALNTGTSTKKVLANFRVQEWHFFAKVK